MAGMIWFLISYKPRLKIFLIFSCRSPAVGYVTGAILQIDSVAAFLLVPPKPQNIPRLHSS